MRAEWIIFHMSSNRWCRSRKRSIGHRRIQSNIRTKPSHNLAREIPSILFRQLAITKQNKAEKRSSLSWKKNLRTPNIFLKKNWKTFNLALPCIVIHNNSHTCHAQPISFRHHPFPKPNNPAVVIQWNGTSANDTRYHLFSTTLSKTKYPNLHPRNTLLA